jgi:hypothetical protein
MSVFDKMTAKQAYLRAFQVTWALCGILAREEGRELNDSDLRKVHNIRMRMHNYPVLTDEEFDIILQVLEKDIIERESK